MGKETLDDREAKDAARTGANCLEVAGCGSQSTARAIISFTRPILARTPIMLRRAARFWRGAIRLFF
jgi:hypothetical protein